VTKRIRTPRLPLMHPPTKQLMIESYQAGHRQGIKQANKDSPFRTPAQIADDIRKSKLVSEKGVSKFEFKP